MSSAVILRVYVPDTRRATRGMEELDATSGRSARRAPWEAATMALLTSVCIQLLFHFTISTTMAPRPRDAPPAPGLLATAFSFVSREIESFITTATGGEIQQVRRYKRLVRVRCGGWTRRTEHLASLDPARGLFIASDA